MKYYLIDELEFDNYILSMEVMLQLMEEGKIPYNKKVKEAFKITIQKFKNQKLYKEADE